MATAATTPRQIPLVLPGHSRPLAELQFLAPPSEPNRTFLVSACHDKMPMIRDASTGDWIGTFQGHKGAVWSTKLDPMGYLAATASGDFSVKVWDGVTGKELFTYVHKHIVKTVDFSLDSKKLATGGHEGILRVFDLSLGNKADAVGSVKEMKMVKDGKVNITKAIWLDNDVVLAAASDGKIRGWNVLSQKLVCTLEVGAGVRDMEVTHLQDQTVLTVAAGTTVSFFQLATNSSNNTNENKTVDGVLLHQHKMPIHFREEGGASLHPDGNKFVAGGSDLWVRVFDFASGEELECHRGHHGPIRCLRYAPDGKTYATGSEDGTIRLWKTDPVVE